MSKLLYDVHPLSVFFDLLRSDAHISVNKALMFAIGVNEALIYSELLSRQAYFDSRDQLTEDGYFFNTIDDLESGTSLSVYQQRIAINNLKKLGLIDVQVKGLPPKRFFKIEQDTAALVNLLNQGKNQAEKVRKFTKIQNLVETNKTNCEKLSTNKKKNNAEQFVLEHELGVLTALGEVLRPKSRWNRN